MCKKQNVTEKERWRIVKKLFQNAVISIVLITFPSRFANAEKNILRQYMIADLYVLTTKNITGTENKNTHKHSSFSAQYFFFYFSLIEISGGKIITFVATAHFPPEDLVHSVESEYLIHQDHLDIGIG